MKERLLSLPQLLFIVGTRAVLGAGVALLATGRMTDSRKKRNLGLTLAAVGAATTIPAARIFVKARPTLLQRLSLKFS
jgi:hypothetical protein